MPCKITLWDHGFDVDGTSTTTWDQDFLTQRENTNQNIFYLFEEGHITLYLYL